MTDAAAPPVIEGVEWVRPRPDRSSLRSDLVLALVLAACTSASVALYRTTGLGEGSEWWQSALWVAVMTLPLAARRVWPETVALVASAVFIVGGVTEVGELLFSNICLFIAIYSVGAWSRSRLRALIVRAVIVLGMFAWLFWALIFFSAVQDHLPDLSREGTLSPYVAYSLINVVTNLLYFGGAWYFGDAAYRSARARAELEQRTAELAAERERTRAQAVALERVRIARELHDVVAHHVSVMGVQAGAARRVLSRDPDAAAAALSAIESSARDAVTELHGLLGTLRADAGAMEPAGRGGVGAAVPSRTVPDDASPARGLDDLGDLAAESAASGLPTTFTVVGEPGEASPIVSASAYRVVQEALTNVRKHAGATATADVRVRWSDGTVEVEVANTGGAGAESTERGSSSAMGLDGAGLGQLGMRERVAATGGTLELGRRARGGYLVRARFPARRVQEARA
jgi:signal transduction histidine kinase